MPELRKDSTSVTRYVMIVDSVTGVPETGVDVTTLDLQYTRNRATPAAKVDATSLGAIDAAWDDNKIFEVDGTSSAGLYRVDWPDAAFATGVDKVELVVSGAGFAPAVEEIALVDRVDVGSWLGTAVTLSAGAPDVNIQSTDDIDLSATQKTSVNTEADNAIETYNLDHLLAVADADDVVDDSVIAKLAVKAATADWSAFDNTTDSLQAIRDNQADLTPQRILSGTSTASSTAAKVYIQAGDPPTGGVDNDYNSCLIAVWRGTSKTTARLNVRSVTDYDDSDPSFTLDVALGFVPQNGDLVEVYVADTATLAALAQLTTGFGTSSPDTLEAYLRAIMSKAASAPANAGTYDPATDSLEVLGEGQVAMKGAGFATGTDSLAEIRDAIDTLVAPSVVGASALSGSGFLSDCVTLIRQMTDEPALVPKYTDADVVERLTSAMTVVMSEVHNNSDHNILCRFDITLVSGQQTYILPPNVGEIWAVRKMSTTTPVTPVYEVWADNHWSSHQSGFVIEYNEFRLLTDWKSTDVLEILYVPNGESYMHYGTAAAFDADTITLAAVPTDGTLDTRANAYAGYLCRLLSMTAPIYVQERVIDSYVNTTRIATFNTALSPLPTGTVLYEVLPTYSNVIKHCACLLAAMDITENDKRLKKYQAAYMIKMRALRQMIAKKSSRFGGHAIGDTSDNDYRGDFYGWLA